MPTFYRTVEVDLDEFDDEDLAEELRSRGFTVSEKNDESETEMIFVEYYWQRGDKKEALILLERQFPELIGIAKLAD